VNDLSHFNCQPGLLYEVNDLSHFNCQPGLLYEVNDLSHFNCQSGLLYEVNDLSHFNCQSGLLYEMNHLSHFNRRPDCQLKWLRSLTSNKNLATTNVGSCPETHIKVSGHLLQVGISLVN
jgi:hypothetical protein